MSFLIDHRTGDAIDSLDIGPVLDDTRVTTAQQDAAWSVIQRYCPDDADLIGRMLGVTK